MADCSKSGDEDELMLELELSIGGIFGKQKKPNRNQDSRYVGIKDNNNIQAGLRRRELRRKREEKMKKPVDYGSCGSISGPFLENKEWLETQIVGQNDDERVRKKEKVGDGDSSYIILSTGCQSFRPRHDENKNLDGCASSPYSDGHCSSHQGGATDDSRSNSSNSQLDQHLATTSTTSVDPIEQPTSSTKQTVSTTKLTTNSTNSESNPTIKPNNQSISIPPPKPETDSSQHQQASLLAKMPCVSTTGNGPNGKTVNGVLYRYTKNEVSIVCVCHGQSFSPAGFVEHAGGIDIAYPLKHITIFPPTFAS